MVTLSRKLLGYVDQPPGTLVGAADAARLLKAGANKIYHEADIRRRSVWREMVAACQDGDVVVVVSLDRIGRPMRSLLQSVADLCGAGVRLRCLDGSVDIGAVSRGCGQAQIIDALVGCLHLWETSRTRHRGRTMAQRGSRPGAQAKLAALSPDDVLTMLQKPGVTRTSVARELGVGRTTLYRYLNRTSTSDIERQAP